MSDLIDRKALMDIMRLRRSVVLRNNGKVPNESYWELSGIMAVISAFDAEPANFDWIPVDAMKPKDCSEVMCTAVSDIGRRVALAYYYKGAWNGVYNNEKVVAWAYFPEPFEEE